MADKGMNRRDFLRNLGIGAAVAAAPAILVPEKRIWQVHPNTPVSGAIWELRQTAFHDEDLLQSRKAAVKNIFDMSTEEFIEEMASIGVPFEDYHREYLKMLELRKCPLTHSYRPAGSKGARIDWVVIDDPIDEAKLTKNSHDVLDLAKALKMEPEFIAGLRKTLVDREQMHARLPVDFAWWRKAERDAAT